MSESNVMPVVPAYTGEMDVDESNRFLLLTDKHPTLEDIYVLQDLLFHNGNQVELVVKEYWAEGVYAREIFIPKGSCAVGKMHAKDQLSVMTKGEMTLMTEEGVIRIKAPFVMVAKPGIKRAVYAHEDTVFMSFHHNPDNLHDPVELEAMLILPPDQRRRLEKAP